VLGGQPGVLVERREGGAAFGCRRSSFGFLSACALEAWEGEEKERVERVEEGVERVEMGCVPRPRGSKRVEGEVKGAAASDPGLFGESGLPTAVPV